MLQRKNFAKVAVILSYLFISFSGGGAIWDVPINQDSGRVIAFRAAADLGRFGLCWRMGGAGESQKWAKVLGLHFFRGRENPNSRISECRGWFPNNIFLPAPKSVSKTRCVFLINKNLKLEFYRLKRFMSPFSIVNYDRWISGLQRH